MKLKVTVEQWERVSRQIKLVRLRNKITPKGYILENYIHMLEPPKGYPRIHFITHRGIGRNSDYVYLMIHADRKMHSEFDYYHPKLEKIKNMFLHS